MKTKALRFGIIGGGNIGRIHIKALRAAGKIVAAIADPDPGALNQASQLAPEARLESDWRKLLEDPQIDAINICTIGALHLEVLKAAVASGKHVLCEKTLTIGEKQAREALKIHLSSSQVVQVGYMKRFFPASIKAKAWIEKIGKPLCATVRSFQIGGSGAAIFNDPGWQPNEEGISRIRAFAGGGMLNMAGSHMLDMAAWLLGEPESIAFETWSPETYDAELHAHGLFRMRIGTIVHFEAALSNFSKAGPYENGWDELIRIDGTEGRLEIRYPLWNRTGESPASVRFYRESTGIWEQPAMPAVDAFQLEMEAFAEACSKGGPAPITIRDGVLVDLWIDKCYESVRSGRRLDFPAF